MERIKNYIHAHKQKVKFLLVGGWNTLIGYLIFVALDSLFVHLFALRYVAYMSAMMVGQILAIMNAFIFHKYVTFKSEIAGFEILHEFVRFCMTYGVTFILSVVLMPLYVEKLHLLPRLAALAVTFTCVVISYVFHSSYTFKHSNDAEKGI